MSYSLFVEIVGGLYRAGSDAGLQLEGRRENNVSISGGEPLGNLLGFTGVLLFWVIFVKELLGYGQAAESFIESAREYRQSSTWSKRKISAGRVQSVEHLGSFVPSTFCRKQLRTIRRNSALDGRVAFTVARSEQPDHMYSA